MSHVIFKSELTQSCLIAEYACSHVFYKHLTYINSNQGVSG